MGLFPNRHNYFGNEKSGIKHFPIMRFAPDQWQIAIYTMEWLSKMPFVDGAVI